jgi:hypothetical protein
MTVVVMLLTALSGAENDRPEYAWVYFLANGFKKSYVGITTTCTRIDRGDKSNCGRI